MKTTEFPILDHDCELLARKELFFSNGISMELEESEGKFRGIRAVRSRGQDMRFSRLPWIFYAESDEDDREVHFENFTLEDVSQNRDEAVLFLKSKGVSTPRLQAADAMGEATRRIEVPEALFFWRFRAITKTIHESEWNGLAMSIECRSESVAAHWWLRLQAGGTHVLWLDEWDKAAVLFTFRENVPKPPGYWLDAETSDPADAILESGKVYFYRD